MNGLPGTLPEAMSLPAAQRAQWLRRAGLALLFVIVLLGATGLLGVHTSTVAGNGGGYQISLTYPRIARAGWDVQFHLEIRRIGGFDEPVTIVMTTDYFNMFESQRWWPEPSEEFRDSQFIYFTFDGPPGGILMVDYDAYIQPTAQRGKDLDVAVLSDGEPVAHVHASTFLLP